MVYLGIAIAWIGSLVVTWKVAYLKGGNNAKRWVINEQKEIREKYKGDYGKPKQ